MADPSLTDRRREPSPPAGRARELEILQTCLEETVAGRGGLVLIAGETGIGKSALVCAVAQEAVSAGCLVLASHCYDLTATPPYGPWRSLVSAFGTGQPSEPLPAALTEEAPNVASQAALFAEVSQYVDRLSERSPVVLIFEDIHWADPGSLDLLRTISRGPIAARCLMIVTYRADEVTRRHPLYQLLPILTREAAATRIDLRRLDDHAVRTLVDERHSLPEADAARLVAYLEHHAEGNPLYIRELLRTLEEESVLARDGIEWTLGDLSHLTVPSLIQQVIDGRVMRLGDQTHETLAQAAVIGQDVRLDLWRTLSGCSEESLVEMVERAVEAHILVASPRGDRVSFSHALVRATLYEAILPPRRRILHRAVAETLATSPSADPDAVAYHFDRASDPRASDWLVRAGDRAQLAYAWRTAADRFERAAATMEGNAEFANQRGWLLYRVGRLLRSADAAKGEALLAAAATIGRSLDDPVLAAYALFDQGTILCIGGDVARGLAAMELGDAALAALFPRSQYPSDVNAWVADARPHDRWLAASSVVEVGVAEVHPRRGTLVFWLALAGRLVEARAIGEPYLAQVSEIDRPDAILLSSAGDAHFGLGLVQALMGEPTAAEGSFGRALDCYRAIGHHMLEAVTLDIVLATVHTAFHSTNSEDRRRLLGQVDAAFVRAKGALAAGLSTRLFWSYDVLLFDGAWDRAEEDALRSRAHGDATERFYATTNLARLAGLRGEVDTAWSLIDELLPGGALTTAGNIRFVEGLALQRLAAGLAIEVGDVPTALTWIEAHDRWLDDSGCVRWRAESQILRAQLYRSTGHGAGAAHLADVALKLASSPTQPLSKITARRLLGELAADSGSFDEADLHLAEALSLATASDAPFERALILVASAELRISMGQATEVESMLAAARSICTPLRAWPVLARCEAIERRGVAASTARARGELSDRERQVLARLIEGCTDREIAELLFISRRTASKHVEAILSKLGVRTRGAAVAEAGRRGLTDVVSSDPPS